jgi:amino acid adenylation domain-containing protein
MSAASGETCVPRLLQAQFLRNPQAVAVQFEGRSLTYYQLYQQSNQLARILRNAGVARDVRVGVYVERSIEMVIALVAIMQAGGGYVPIDPAHGSGRMENIAGESGFNILLTQNSLTGGLPFISAPIVLLDELKQAEKETAKALAAEQSLSDLAYMIYTSGSTGKPKGVQIEHRSLLNLLTSMRREPGFEASDTLLAVTTLAFDIAGLEIFLPLLAGGRLAIASRETASDGKLLMKALETSGATVMQATPATWRMLFESGWRGNRALKVLVGGEALPAELGRELVSRCREVWNMYGPTETTIWSSIYRVTGKEERTVPIGRPILNTEFHILDENYRAVKPGDEGELCIGGEGLARGYFERAQLAAEKFIPDPFGFRPGIRLYRTGDLVRRTPDGNFHFLGRTDHQVKIRGFRIEPGEIESIIDQNPDVRHSVVIAREDRAGEKFLAAYIVPVAGSSITPAKLRRHLSGKVPEYMTPRAFVQLAELPLTPNRKVDRAALPSPQAPDFQEQQDYAAPVDKIQRKLVALWEEVLDIRPIGVETSFFDLGGHSLIAVRLFVKIKEVFGKDLPLSTLYRAPTIGMLAEELRSIPADKTYSTLVAIKPSGFRRPFFCIHGGLGGILFFKPLVSYMDSDQPFYGIESEGLDGAPFRRRTVEEMASYYLAEIRKIQPEGPYLLGGYCLGGIIAFEMAQQLLRSGDSAALVAQFSAPLFYNSLEKPVAISTPGLRRPSRSLWKSAKTAVWILQNQIRIGAGMTAYRLFHMMRRRVPQKMRTLYIPRMLGRAEKNYVPKPYTGTLTLFHGRHPDYAAPNLGWNGLAKTFETHIIGSGTVNSRRSIMEEPLVRQLATELTECLDRVCAELEPAVAERR